MRVNITPIVVDGVIYSQANVYVAVSNSVAVRVVPVGPDGTEYPDAAIGIVGASGDPSTQDFMTDVTAAVLALLADRGI